jgi:DNA-directed RNA polymerase II subunit RPB1
MLMTSRDTFITHEDLMNLVMWIDDLDAIPQPAILKPKPLWTGKQVFSLVMPRLQYMRFNETPKSHNWASSKDKNILIHNGEILCGQLTSAQVGKTGGGIVHIIWKEFGCEAVKSFLSQSQCVINNWLMLHGMTVGVSDIIAREKTMALIRSTLRK